MFDLDSLSKEEISMIEKHIDRIISNADKLVKMIPHGILNITLVKDLILNIINFYLLRILLSTLLIL